MAMKAKDLSKWIAGEVTRCILLYTFLLLVLLSSQICVQASTPVAQTYTISGQLTDGFGNALSSWIVTLNGTQTATTTTDMLGNYSFSNLQAGGNYIAGPASGGPNTLIASRDVNNLSSDVTVNLVVLFFANFQVRVRDSSGNGIAAVAIRVNNEPVAFAQTNSFGIVNIGVNIPVTNNGPPVTLTPEKPGYVFIPPSVTLSTQNTSQIVNFTGSISNAPLIQFGASFYAVGEGNQRANITVTRTGDTSGAASVSYATIDDAGPQPCGTINSTASPRCDYSPTSGTIQFAAGETSKSISVDVIDDSYAENTEIFRVSLNNPQGAILGTPSTANVTIIDNDSVNGPNPIDAANWFVLRHYLDFLNREPDPPGFGFWTEEIDNCTPKPRCTEIKRINVSAAFYLSIEFQGTGYLVERIYKTAYGDANGTSTLGGTHQLPVPIVRFNEFLPDTQEIGQGVIVNQGNWQQQLENNKQAFCAEFVQRSRFTTAFPVSMTAAQFVDTLNANAGNPLSQSERDQLVTDLSTNAMTRAQVLRAVAEDPDLNSAEFNRAFVLMQYFGYLRRNPNDPQDTDYTGYDFWLTKLNQFNGNFVNADMVKAFITSGEYRNRFGP
jgi:hypothetical protein